MFKFSNKETYAKYEPEGNISKKLYKISEKIRCEKLELGILTGLKNIENFYQEISQIDIKSSEDKIMSLLKLFEGKVFKF